METVTQMLLLFVTYIATNGATMMKVMAATGKRDAPIFIFGDSTTDVGTNNHLPTCTAKADHRYHGIDFSYSKPTRRFSNGKNAADQIVRLLGNHQDGLAFLAKQASKDLLGKNPSMSFRPVKSAEIFWQFWASCSFRVSLAHDGS
ncbi:hypothetical protein Tco_1132728 [Tanacetum coccineum]|uniref:GDSL esterase/lipase n=1 Tax=Tanacetum coccineum TaxID=301880 RepID=A0ABQ5JCQ9_9ASTR